KAAGAVCAAAASVSEAAPSRTAESRMNRRRVRMSGTFGLKAAGEFHFESAGVGPPHLELPAGSIGDFARHRDAQSWRVRPTIPAFVATEPADGGQAFEFLVGDIAAAAGDHEREQFSGARLERDVD